MKLGAAKRGIVGVLGALGGHMVINFAMRRSPRIFMYHRFTTTEEPRKLSVTAFESHLRLLSRNFNIVTMAELLRQVRTHGAAEPYTAVITIDDGHRDFLELAVPLLRRYGMPATLFVATRFVEGEFWLWPDRLEYAVFQTRKAGLSLDDGRRWPLTDAASRWRAWNDLVQECVRLPHYDKERLLEEAVRDLGVLIPDAPAAPYQALSIDELRQLNSTGIEIGAHTQRHPILSRLPESELDEEIAGSKHRIETWLQTEVLSFCYPNGAPGDYSPLIKSRVQAAGFTSAVCAHFRYDVLADLFEIKRYSGAADFAQFRRNAYGVEYVSSLMRSRIGG